MDIRAAMTRIIAVQAALTITDPIAASIKKAWRYTPPQSQTVTETPAFINSWTLNQETRYSNGYRRHDYTVHMQLLVEDSDKDRAADIASAFHAALLTAFDADVQLAGACSGQTIRGGDPTLANFEFAGNPYIGLDLYMDIRMDDVTVNEP
jgi:hypothetical protein